MKKFLLVLLIMMSSLGYSQSTCSNASPFTDSCVVVDPTRATVCYWFIPLSNYIDLDFTSSSSTSCEEFDPFNSCFNIKEYYSIYNTYCDVLYINTTGIFTDLIPGDRYTVCYSSFCPPNGGNTNTIRSSEGISLPIELLYFNGRNIGSDHIKFSWATGSEFNNSHFNIFTSVDLVNWFDVGRVSSVGNSQSVNYYSFEHRPTHNGVSYFKLKQTDIDGRYMYSDIIAVEFFKDSNEGFLRKYNVIGQQLRD